MAHHDSIRGAIGPGVLLFPVTEVRDAATYPALAQHLGQVVDLKDGAAAMLVKAAGAVIASPVTHSFCYEFAGHALTTVQLTAGAGSATMGFSAPGLVAQAADDFHYVLVPGLGRMRVSLLDSGADCAANALIQATAAGEIVTDATPNLAAEADGVTFGQVQETSGAGGVADVLVIRGLRGDTT